MSQMGRFDSFRWGVMIDRFRRDLAAYPDPGEGRLSTQMSQLAVRR